jgi:hypothetical protein
MAYKRDELKDKLFVHFKGNVYRVISSQVINDIGTRNVIYKRVFPEDDDQQWYTQTLERFEEVVYREGQKYLRFYPIKFEEYKDIVENGIYPCLIYKPSIDEPPI